MHLKGCILIPKDQGILRSVTKDKLSEGLFWHDPDLDGLNDSDRKWAIIKMGFRSDFIRGS